MDLRCWSIRTIFQFITQMKALKIETSCDNFHRFQQHIYILIYIDCSCAHFFWCALLVDWMTSATSGSISTVYNEPMSMTFHQKSNRHQKMKFFIIFFALISSVAAITASEMHLKTLRARKYNSANIIEKPSARQLKTYKLRRLSVLRWLH